jgi:hypothetical protein
MGIREAKIKMEESESVQIEMAGRCREWFTVGKSDEMDSKGK